VTAGVVARWKRNDDPILLLRLPKTNDLPRAVRRYLDTEEGQQARQAYKCRVRDPNRTQQLCRGAAGTPRLIEDLEGKVIASQGQAEPEAGSLCARRQYEYSRADGGIY